MHLGNLIFLIEAFNSPLSVVKFGPVSLNALITVLLLFFCLFVSLQFRIPIPNNRSGRLSFQFLLMFVAIIFLHIPFAGKIEGAQTFNILSAVAFAFLVLAVFRSNSLHRWDLRKFHRCVLIAIVLALGVYYLQRAIGVRGAPRGEATYLLICLAWVLGAIKFKVCSRKIGIFLIVAIVLTIMLMLSRTALFTAFLLIGLGISNPQRFNLKFIAKGSILAVTAVGIFIYLVLNYEPLYDRFFTGDLSIQYGAIRINAMGRTNMWALLLGSMNSFPIVGQGAGASSMLLSSYYGIDHVHNDYLRVLYDFGVGGLFVWVGFLAFATFSCLRNWRRANSDSDQAGACHVAAFLSIIAFMLLMLTDNVILYGNVVYPLGVLIGLSLSMGRSPMGTQQSQVDIPTYAPPRPVSARNSVD